VYIDDDVDMDKEGHPDDEQDGEGTEDVTGFSELDADMTVFANLGNNEGVTVAQAQQDVLPSSSQLSGGGVSVSTGIIEEGEEGEGDGNDIGTEIMDRETGISPVQHFATLGNGEAANASPSAIVSFLFQSLYCCSNVDGLWLTDVANSPISASTNTHTVINCRFTNP